MGSAILPNGGNNRVYTPNRLALQIVQHFSPQFEANHTFLEPCRGKGAFYRAIKKVTGKAPEWCEIDKKRDFLKVDPHMHFDWIITNPPYGDGLLLQFLKKSFEMSDNVLFLIAATVPFFTAKQRAADAAGFELKETFRVPTPPEWVDLNLKVGMGYAACHWQRGYIGPQIVTRAEGWRAGLGVATPAKRRASKRTTRKPPELEITQW